MASNDLIDADTLMQTTCPVEDLRSDRLKEFDAGVAKITDARGNVYGHPSVNFDRIQRLRAVVAECQDPLAREALDMICVKVARLIQTPTHVDSWLDIAGYARCGVMVTDSK